MYIKILGKIQHPKKLTGITFKNTETQKITGFSRELVCTYPDRLSCKD